MGTNQRRGLDLSAINASTPQRPGSLLWESMVVNPTSAVDPATLVHWVDMPVSDPANGIFVHGGLPNHNFGWLRPLLKATTGGGNADNLTASARIWGIMEMRGEGGTGSEVEYFGAPVLVCNIVGSAAGLNVASRICPVAGLNGNVKKGSFADVSVAKSIVIANDYTPNESAVVVGEGLPGTMVMWDGAPGYLGYLVQLLRTGGSPAASVNGLVGSF
jgi:hypothetical protein